MSFSEKSPLLVSSPLTDLPSSNPAAVESREERDPISSGQDESSQEIVDVGPSSDSMYTPNVGHLFTSTMTPLKNKPHGSKHMTSSSIKILQDNAHAPGVCILTRATPPTGLIVQKSHMVPQALSK